MCVTLKDSMVYVGDVLRQDETVVVVETVDGIRNIDPAEVRNVTKAVSVVSRYKQKQSRAKTAADHYEP